jgi:hypothetical protein
MGGLATWRPNPRLAKVAVICIEQFVGLLVGPISHLKPIFVGGAPDSAPGYREAIDSIRFGRGIGVFVRLLIAISQRRTAS